MAIGFNRFLNMTFGAQHLLLYSCEKKVKDKLREYSTRHKVD